MVNQKKDLSTLSRKQAEAQSGDRKQRISRAAMLKAAFAGAAGVAITTLYGSQKASAAPMTTTDTNFVATGSATAAVGFDASPSFANRFIDGVNAQGTNTGVTGTSDNFGVLGLNQGSGYGIGVIGESTNGDGVVGIADSNNFVAGVKGRGAASAYGGWFESSSGAQLHLTPSTTIGYPTFGNYQAGDIFVDAHVTVWICVAAGNPGTWVKVKTH